MTKHFRAGFFRFCGQASGGLPPLRPTERFRQSKVKRARSQVLGKDYIIRTSIPPATPPSLEEPAATNQLQHLIEAAIRELPSRGQQIFRLNRFSGLTCQQIADTHGLSPKTVETHRRRNLIFLRKRLQRYCELPL